MHTSSLSAGEVTAFFARYGTEFDSCNWPAFVALYHEPALSVRGDGSVTCLMSRADARTFFENVVAAWHLEGYQRFEARDLDVMPLGSRSLLATLDWHMLRGDGSLIRKWRQSYQLILVQQEWQVLASTFHAP